MLNLYLIGDTIPTNIELISVGSISQIGLLDMSCVAAQCRWIFRSLVSLLPRITTVAFWSKP